MTTATATATAPQMKNQHVTAAVNLGEVHDLTRVLHRGDFLSAALVTDTVVYEVVKVTPKTATLRTTRTGTGVYSDEQCDASEHGMGVVWQEVVSDPDGDTKVVRLTKKGTLRNGNYARAGVFRKSMLVNGSPVKRVDYRF